MSRRARTRMYVGALALAMWVTGCRHGPEFMWVDDVPKAMRAVETTYEIGPGDLISVRVFNQEANSVERVRVRDDGKISLPFLNDVIVAGTEPVVLARRLEVRLKEFITSPVVTVVVHERRPVRVSVLGKVNRPGVYDLEQGAGVIHAIASAGGLTAFADEDRVFVLRPGYWADAERVSARIRLRYSRLSAGTPPDCTFLVRSGDVIVVE